jgi:hypothetical protein
MGRFLGPFTGGKSLNCERAYAAFLVRTAVHRRQEQPSSASFFSRFILLDFGTLRSHPFLGIALFFDGVFIALWHTSKCTDNTPNIRQFTGTGECAGCAGHLRHTVAPLPENFLSSTSKRVKSAGSYFWYDVLLSGLGLSRTSRGL